MTKKLRPDEIAKLFDKATASASRSWSPEDIGVKLFAIGEGGAESDTELTPEQRDEMLAKCVPGGPHLQLDVEMLAYEQKSGERNRNAVRLRDESVIATGSTGKNKPCLKDHEHYDQMSVAGRILWSRGAKVSEGHYAIRMRVRLTALWAIELALRDLLGAVSISWEALGPIMCTACNAPIRTKCWHYPGMRVSEMPQQDGTKRFVWDPNGTIVVEWLYTKAGILEVSLVPIGAVQNAAIDGIRAALSAAGLSDEESLALLNGEQLDQDNSTPPADVPQPARMSKLDAALAAHNELTADERKAFAAKLAAAVEAELAADPVVHTCKDGTIIRQSHGAVALMLAKQADASAAREEKAANELLAATAARVAETLKAKAKSEIGHLAGSDDVKLAALQAIESIADEKVRGEVLAMFKAADAVMAELATPKGAGGEDAPALKPADAAAAFTALSVALTAFCATNKIEAVWTEGLAAFKKTPEGKRLADAYAAFTK